MKVTSISPRLAAVILTGGAGSRLGGADKASIEVRGSTLLEHALAATAAAEEVVVVGPRLPTSRPVTWAREDPPGGGPAAGLLAGLHALTSPPGEVCLLAVDMPRFTAATLARLREALSSAEGAGGVCLLDDEDRRQWLAGVYRFDALLAAAPPRTDGAAHGLPLHRLMMPLQVTTVRALDEEAHDVDTWADLHCLRGSGEV